VNVVAVVGNPKPASRTRGAAELVGELTLKPVLSEIGGSCPTPALFLLESSWDASPELDTWIERAWDVLQPPGG
jgi:hypothetical protein